MCLDVCTVLGGPAEVVQHDVVVAAAQHPALHQTKLLPGGQLPLTGEAGEAGQVVHAAPGPPHPVTGVHLTPTLGTLGAKPTVGRNKTEKLRLAGIKSTCLVVGFQLFGAGTLLTGEFFVHSELIWPCGGCAAISKII